MDYSKLGETPGKEPAKKTPGKPDYGTYGDSARGRYSSDGRPAMGAVVPKLPAEALFMEHNQRRIQIALQISQKSSLAIHLVPVLLQFNHPKLPGYVEGPYECCGIAYFELTDDMRQTASQYLQDYKPLERELLSMRPRKTTIESVMVMGSVGSSAQSAESDFDYWVIIDETKISVKEAETLQKKLTIVEGWAAKQNVELHFFISDVNRVRANDFGRVDEESAGSSQANILKEEFYRTHIHLSGKRPLWWLTPLSATDAEYEEARKKLVASPEFARDRYVDLGNVSAIGSGEIFGAALWQINKAMESPFKSVMKIALLESYIDPLGEKTMLCDELKRNVLLRNREPEMTDPYLIMINRLLGLYERQKRADVIALIRKCFYNKVKIKITPAVRAKQTLSFKEEAMLRYIDRWKWDDATVAHLNNYENWDFDMMLKLGIELHSFLIETYRKSTDILKSGTDAKSTISDTDLTILGRKLFSFYNRKPGKIDPFKRASDDAVRQESITFMPVVQPGKKPVWHAYRGNVVTEVARKSNVEHAIIRKSTSLAELVCWLTVNMVMDTGTFLHLIPNPLPLHLKTVQDLVKLINDFMPYRSISSIRNEALLHSPAFTSMILIANLVSQPWTKDLEELTLLYTNTHGERFCETVDPKTAPTKIAEVAGNATTDAVLSPFDFFRIYIPKSEGCARIEKSFRTLLMGKIKKA